MFTCWCLKDDPCQYIYEINFTRKKLKNGDAPEESQRNNHTIYTSQALHANVSKAIRLRYTTRSWVRTTVFMTNRSIADNISVIRLIAEKWKSHDHYMTLIDLIAGFHYWPALPWVPLKAIDLLHERQGLWNLWKMMYVNRVVRHGCVTASDSFSMFVDYLSVPCPNRPQPLVEVSSTNTHSPIWNKQMKRPYWSRSSTTHWSITSLQTESM